MHFFYRPNITENILTLDENESRHCIRALRLKIHDEVRVTDGRGTLCKARLIDDHIRHCRLEIVSQTTIPQKQTRSHIAIAPTKNLARTEWFVEKAIELGVDQISLILCERAERTKIKKERLEKIAIAALKQSQQVYMPAIHPPVPLAEFILRHSRQPAFIAHCVHKVRTHLFEACIPGKENTVLIGPEGDFSRQEVDFALAHHYKGVHLGANRLRTETAGIAACHILSLKHQLPAGKDSKGTLG